MNKLSRPLICIFTIVGLVFATPHLDDFGAKHGTRLMADTLHTVQPFGPGSVHHSYTITDVPYTIDVMEIDWPNGFLTLKAAIARDTINGKQLQRTTSIAQEHDSAGHRVIGAINGDFFDISGTGLPINLHVERSEIAMNPINREAFGVTIDKKLGAAIFQPAAGLTLSDGQSVSVQGFNIGRGENQLVFYNQYEGPNTGTNQWGTELLVEPVTGWAVNDTFECRVINKEFGVGSMNIPDGFGVFSGHGTSSNFLNDNVSVGDTIRAYLGVTPDFGRIVEAIGGGPMILRNGNPTSSGTAVHPRTAIAFNQDTSKVFLFTVDGRMEASAGMSFPQMADFMSNVLGAWTAINLDGGGSSTMVVRHQIVNTPSDPGGERLVGNALLLVSSAPLDTLTGLRISPKRKEIYGGPPGAGNGLTVNPVSEEIQFTVEGWDQYYNPLPVDSMDLTFHADPNIGVVSSTGLFSPAARHDSGYVWVESSNGIRDTAFVVVNTLQELRVYPNSVVCDSGETLRLSVLGLDTGQHTVAFSRGDSLRWELVNCQSDAPVGTLTTVGSAGTFTANDWDRCGTVEVSLGSIETVADIAVTDTGTSSIDDFTILSPYIPDFIQLNEDSSRVRLSAGQFQSPPFAFRLDYTYDYYTRVRSKVRLQRTLRLPGTPDILRIGLWNDEGEHFVSFEFEDNSGGRFIAETGTAGVVNGWNTLRALVHTAEPQGSDDHIDYPITMKSVTIQFQYSDEQGGERYTGTVFLDDFVTVASPALDVREQENRQVPEQFALFQNHPNPFNPETRIEYQVPTTSEISLDVFDITGKRVTQLDRGVKSPGIHSVRWNAADVSSGVYFYRLRSDLFSSTKKCIVIK